MRTYKEAEQAGKNVGFELVRSVDIATVSPVASPWCAPSPARPARRAGTRPGQGLPALHGVRSPGSAQAYRPTVPALNRLVPSSFTVQRGATCYHADRPATGLPARGHSYRHSH